MDPVQAGTKLEPKKTVPATVTSEKQASGETLDRPPGESAAMHAQKAVDASFAAKMAADTAMQASNMSASLVQLAESNMNLIGIETRAEAVNDEAAESRNMSQRLSWADQAADGAGALPVVGYGLPMGCGHEQYSCEKRCRVCFLSKAR